MASYEDFLRENSDHPRTRDDLVKLYSTEYKDSWKQRLSEDIQLYTRGRNGQPQSIRTIRRRFEDRYGRHWYNVPPSPAHQAQYQALGETINLPPQGGYRGHVDAVLWISRTLNSRSWDFHVTGQAALALAGGDVNILIQAYGQKPGGDHVFSLDRPAPQDDFTEGFDSMDIA